MTTDESPLILVLDTAQEDCAAALVRGETLLAVRVETVGSRHTERIFDLIDGVLAEAGETKRAIGAVAFGAGPGAFTGLRVACGVAQGIAWSLQEKVVPVSNLAAEALAALEQHPLSEGSVILAANDARMHECYTAAFRVDPDAPAGLSEIEPPKLVRPEDLAHEVRAAGAAILAGSALVVYPEETREVSDICLTVPARASHPEALARLASALLEAGRTLEPAQASPLYVRNRVALTKAERDRGERLV